MSFIYLHFSNCKFLTFCSIDWFRFQKPLAIGPFRIPRCQEFWDKSFGWFLGFQFKEYLEEKEKTYCILSLFCNVTLKTLYNNDMVINSPPKSVKFYFLNDNKMCRQNYLLKCLSDHLFGLLWEALDPTTTALSAFKGSSSIFLMIIFIQPCAKSSVFTKF